MELVHRINVLSELGRRIERKIFLEDDPVIVRAINENPWFTYEGIVHALDSISKNYLDRSKLERWISGYPIYDNHPKNVGLVLAGNIPLVGIHDFLSVFAAGHKAVLKYSSKDKTLMSWMRNQLIDIEPSTRAYFKEVEKLNQIDAVIATGGDAAATHFHYYFSKYPNIIRKNRSSVGVIRPDDELQSLEGLGEDIFTYFGLGCRNISKLYLPEGFDIQRIFQSIAGYKHVIDHNKYKNNYDYSHAIYLLGQKKFYTNNFLIIKEDNQLSSRIACLHFERYTSEEELEQKLKSLKESIQCIASVEPFFDFIHIPIGTCQSPALTDYADGVDTLQFLTELYD